MGKRKCSPDFSSKEKYNVADTYNQKTNRQDTAGSVYQREIFKRRSRYILVFSVLTAAFLIVTVLNINTGNVHISLPEILKILARRGEGGTEANIIWKIRLPRVLMAAILGERCHYLDSYFRLSFPIRSRDRLSLEFRPERR